MNTKIGLLILSTVLAFFLIRQCQAPEHIKTVEYVYDTIVETKIIEPDSIVLTQTVYDTIYEIVKEVDETYELAYYRLVDSLNSIKTYEVSLKDDSTAYIAVSADVGYNRLLNMKYTYQNRRPLQIITNTSSNNGIYGKVFLNKNLGVGVVYVRNNIMYEVGYNKDIHVGVAYKLW